jgi:hypothetical protein
VWRHGVQGNKADSRPSEVDRVFSSGCAWKIRV